MGRRMRGPAAGRRANAADRQLARYRPPPRPAARKTLGRRAPTRRHRPRPIDAPLGLLLLDEPLASLDVARKREILPLSRAPTRRGSGSRWSMSATRPTSCGGSPPRWCGSTPDGSRRPAARNCSTPVDADAVLLRRFAAPPHRLIQQAKFNDRGNGWRRRAKPLELGPRRLAFEAGSSSSGNRKPDRA